MSITVTALAAATPEPLPHTAWCEPARCVIAAGESAIHVHRVGEVAGVRVMVERIDDYTPDDRPRTGRPRVNVYSEGDQPLLLDQVDELLTLLAAAKLFAGEVS